MSVALTARDGQGFWQAASSDAGPPGVNSRQWAIRDGLRGGRLLLQLLQQGRTELERGQLPLW